MKISRSTFYYIGVDWELKDSEVLSEIEEFCLQLPGSGYRAVASHLRTKRDISKNRVQRIMQKNEMQCRVKKKFRKQTTDSNHNMRKYPNLMLERAETGDYTKVITGDITGFDIKGKNHFAATLLDLTNRDPIGIGVSDRIDTELIKSAFEDAKNNRNGDLSGYTHHTDSDSRYCSKEYIKLLKDNNITISMCKGNAYENAFAESFNSVLKRQEIRVNEYDNLKHARASILAFRKKYVELRPHSSLGGLTPKAFAEKNFPELSTYTQRKKKSSKKRKKVTTR